MPLDLRMLAGAPHPMLLSPSRRSLIVGSILRAAIGGFVVLFAAPWMIYAVVLLLRPAGRGGGPTSMWALGLLVLFGLVAIAGVWLLSRLPSRIRAIRNENSTPEELRLRWAWTGSRFWRDASGYPEGDEPWGNFSSVTVSRKRDSLRITLFTKHPPSVPPAKVWTLGAGGENETDVQAHGAFARLWIRATDDEGETIRVELSRHVVSSSS